MLISILILCILIFIAMLAIPGNSYFVTLVDNQKTIIKNQAVIANNQRELETNLKEIKEMIKK